MLTTIILHLKKIVEDWFLEKNLSWETVPLIESDLYGKILPPDVRESFSDFHDQITGARSGSKLCLRIVSKIEHEKLNKTNIQNIYST